MSTILRYYLNFTDIFRLINARSCAMQCCKRRLKIKMQFRKMQDTKMTDQVAGMENIQERQLVGVHDRAHTTAVYRSVQGGRDRTSKIRMLVNFVHMSLRLLLTNRPLIGLH